MSTYSKVFEAVQYLCDRCSSKQMAGLRGHDTQDYDFCKANTCFVCLLYQIKCKHRLTEYLFSLYST